MTNEVLSKNIYDGDDEHYDRSLSNEAYRVVKEISFGVNLASVSAVLEKNDSIAYLNIKTLENEDWCIELSITGYMIVSKQFDKIDEDLKNKNLIECVNKYETIEALMNQISPKFVKKFNDLVAEKLKLIS